MIFDRMMDEYQPLVSVAVVTYNSSKTVVETLDSICKQSYKNLELIVSDDGSTDNTIEICSKWIDLHKERFWRSELFTVKKNTGISANMNRAERACRGEWVKPIAGDDILIFNCIEIYMRFVKEHQGVVYVFAKLVPFGGLESQRDTVKEFYLSHQEFFNWSAEQQYEYLIKKRNCLPAPTAFYHRATINKLGVKNDERIPNLEDWPKWIALLRKKVIFYFLDEETVMYRLGENSISTSVNVSDKYRQSLELFYIHYQFKDDFRMRKREAIKHYLRSKVLTNGNLFWRGLNHVAKKTL